MIFNSLTFLLFLVVLTALYWCLPRRPRLYTLFFASLLFYGFWRYEFIILLLISIGTDFLASRAIDATTNETRRRAFLILSITINLLLLFVFKYLIFFVDTLNGLGQALGYGPEPAFSVPLHIILPLGISFYTFQSISYTVDVYRRFIKPEPDFILFATYVIFFPQLVAGPILRAKEVIWQLADRPPFDPRVFADGLRRILSGLFLKCILADNIAPLVDRGFAADPATLGALDVLTLSFLFGFQIYFDFAGYSFIAIGIAGLLGIRFPDNFNYPYLSQSPREFWQRWHISLSSWIRDYLYLPLCGVNVHDRSTGGLVVEDGATGTNTRRNRSLWITWSLMGFWHGANWTFVAWGLWHAALITVQRASKRLLPQLKIPPVLAWMMTLPLIMLGWIPFRAETLDQAGAMLMRLLTPQAYVKPDVAHGLLPALLFNLQRDTHYVSALLLLLVVAAWALQRTLQPTLDKYLQARSLADFIFFATAAPLVYVFLRPIQQFIYFQF